MVRSLWSRSQACMVRSQCSSQGLAVWRHQCRGEEGKSVALGRQNAWWKGRHARSKAGVSTTASAQGAGTVQWKRTGRRRKGAPCSGRGQGEGGREHRAVEEDTAAKVRPQKFSFAKTTFAWFSGTPAVLPREGLGLGLGFGLGFGLGIGLGPGSVLMLADDM
jgi:hypothetical protein